MRAVSAKRAKLNRERAKVTAAMRAAQPWCTRCGTTDGLLDVDEIKSRARGGSITDPDNMQILCRVCHEWKHANDAAAKDGGWSLSGYGGAA